jgi:hypothetical protein
MTSHETWRGPRREDVMPERRRSWRLPVQRRRRPKARTPFRVRQDMTVRVDQPRQDGGAVEIAGFRGQRPVGIVNRDHPPIVDGEGARLDLSAAVEVEEPDIPEHLAHADELPPTKLARPLVVAFWATVGLPIALGSRPAWTCGVT